MSVSAESRLRTSETRPEREALNRRLRGCIGGGEGEGRKSWWRGRREERREGEGIGREDERKKKVKKREDPEIREEERGEVKKAEKGDGEGRGTPTEIDRVRPAHSPTLARHSIPAHVAVLPWSSVAAALPCFPTRANVPEKPSSFLWGLEFDNQNHTSLYTAPQNYTSISSKS